MAQYGYGLGGPAVAISEVGNSLSDLMKSFAAIKIAEAKTNVESKQVDLGLQRAQGELELNKIKGELEGVKMEAAERHANLADVARQQQIQQTGEHDRAVEALQGRTVGVHEGTEKRLQDEANRLNTRKPFDQHLKESPLSVSEAMLSQITPENRKLMVTTRDFEKWAKEVSEKKPAEMLKLQLMDTHQKLINMYREFRANPNEESGKKLMTFYHNADNLAALVTGDPDKLMEVAIKMSKDPAGIDPPDPELVKENFLKVQQMSKLYRHTLSVDGNSYSGPDELNADIQRILAPKPGPYAGPDETRFKQPKPQPMSADTGNRGPANRSWLSGILSGGQPGSAPGKKVVRTGTEKGTNRKVVEYEDGTFGYAP